MKKSARQLGREYNLSDREMNVVLMNKGYQTGEPGNYEPTAKGLPYVEQHENHHGTGGYSHMNVYYTTMRWDESITDELEITDDDVTEARAYLSQRRKQQRDNLSAAGEDYRAKYNPISEESVDEDTLSENGLSGMDKLYIAIGIGLSAFAGIKWAVNRWNEKVVPKIESKTKKEKCPKCDSKMRYDKKRNCWICKKCGAIKQHTNNHEA